MFLIEHPYFLQHGCSPSSIAWHLVAEISGYWNCKDSDTFGVTVRLPCSESVKSSSPSTAWTVGITSHIRWPVLQLQFIYTCFIGWASVHDISLITCSGVYSTVCPVSIGENTISTSVGQRLKNSWAKLAPCANMYLKEFFRPWRTFSSVLFHKLWC